MQHLQYLLVCYFSSIINRVINKILKNDKENEKVIHVELFHSKLIICFIIKNLFILSQRSISLFKTFSF